MRHSLIIPQCFLVWFYKFGHISNLYNIIYNFCNKLHSFTSEVKWSISITGKINDVFQVKIGNANTKHGKYWAKKNMQQHKQKITLWKYRK